jgi:hypothetical protein
MDFVEPADFHLRASPEPTASDANSRQFSWASGGTSPARSYWRRRLAPRRSVLIAVLACVAGSGTALALPAAEARAQVQRARDNALALRQHQTQLRAELNEVAGRIQELKAQQRGRLIPGGELSGLLRRSQELSGSLTEVESSLARADGEVQEKSGALAVALGQEMDAARAAFDRARRGERRTLLEQVTGAAQSGTSPGPARRAAAQVKAGPSGDGPAEQTDALRDTQDKVTSRLKALGGASREVKREKAQPMRMGEFLGDEQVSTSAPPAGRPAPPPPGRRPDPRRPAPRRRSRPIFPLTTGRCSPPRGPRAPPPPATASRRSARGHPVPPGRTSPWCGSSARELERCRRSWGGRAGQRRGAVATPPAAASRDLQHRTTFAVAWWPEGDAAHRARGEADAGRAQELARPRPG